jgi:hypothetical protein
MDCNPIAAPLRLAIRENHIHAALYRPFESILLDA